MSARTEVQREANEIDLAIFRALGRADHLARKTKAARTEQARWWLVCNYLRQARVQARGAMHPDDIKATS